MNPETGDCRAFGSTVPPDMVGELADVSALLATPERLRERLATDGHAFLRGVLDEGEVMAARHAVFERLCDVGELKPPPPGTASRPARAGAAPTPGTSGGSGSRWSTCPRSAR